MRKSKYFVRPKGRIHEKKVAVLLDFVQITSPQFGQLVQLFLNAKNVDLSQKKSDTFLDTHVVWLIGKKWWLTLWILNKLWHIPMIADTSSKTCHLPNCFYKIRYRKGANLPPRDGVLLVGHPISDIFILLILKWVSHNHNFRELSITLAWKCQWSTDNHQDHGLQTVTTYF